MFAADAASGKVIWEYTRKYAAQIDAVLCCGPANRGVALWGDLIHVETLDARMVALALLTLPAWAADTGFHNPILHDPEAIAAGGVLYQEHCFICHGR